MKGNKDRETKNVDAYAIHQGDVDGIIEKVHHLMQKVIHLHGYNWARVVLIVKMRPNWIAVVEHFMMPLKSYLVLHLESFHVVVIL